MNIIDMNNSWYYDRFSILLGIDSEAQMAEGGASNNIHFQIFLYMYSWYGNYLYYKNHENFKFHDTGIKICDKHKL